MADQPLPPKRIFPTSKVDARAAEHVPSIPQTESAAYKLAFQDIEFLLREDLRPVRFQLDRMAACQELARKLVAAGAAYEDEGAIRIRMPEEGTTWWDDATRPEVLSGDR